MRTVIRMRARMLVAGVGVLLAGAISGCWSGPGLRNNSNQNIPKTNVAPGQGGPGSAYMGASGGQPSVGLNTAAPRPGVSGTGSQPVSRVSGAPGDQGAPRVGLTSGALSSGAASGTAGPGTQLGPPPGGAGSAQPIATNAGARGAQPVANFGAAGANPTLDLDPPPSSKAAASEQELPPLQPTPISYQDVNPKRNWQQAKPPAMPVESEPRTLPAKVRSVEPLAPLGPPPQ